MAKIKLGEICHCRTGDKADISNLGLIVYDKKDYPLIREKVTTEVVKEYFKAMVKEDVVRYELPQLGALNFVMHGFHIERNIMLCYLTQSFAFSASHFQASGRAF